MADVPVVLLAFANEQDGRRYLRDLPEELRRLQAILERAQTAGLCQLVVRPNASLDQILEAFTDYRDRVAVLHYGGHAGGDRLLLESAGGESRPAHSEGLAVFLAHRRKLELVFLNGCSTRAQAAGLLEAGVSAVIATARAIEDTVAMEFADEFYKELAAGQSVHAAYEASRGRVMARRGSAPDGYYRARDLADSSPANVDPTDERGFPWELRLAAGAELAGRWSLPEAAGDPLYGLPRPSLDLLPKTPFRGLQRFTRDEAAVFFGRGKAIRELYGLVVDPGTRPVILYYGPTGVGKSSVLDAGLLPRLEHSHEILYLRREPEFGLLGTLVRGLALTTEGPDSAPQSDLTSRWRGRERSNRPLVAILDQTEEVFTRPHVFVPPADDPGTLSTPWVDPDAELAELLAALKAMYALLDPEQRPRGKLILSFRSEWLDRFEQAFNAVKLGWEPVPLRPLDTSGIVEAITGPAREPVLKRRYGLTVAEGLAQAIAGDLLIDAGSALAPTLQVLLTNMWKGAGGKYGRLDHDLYRRLRNQGYLLSDVLDEGLKRVREWRGDVESSGLALDVLAHHVTEYATAAQWTLAELESRYSHRKDVLQDLLDLLQDGYLLLPTDARTDPAAPPVRATRLAHDTLAPLVQARFRSSIAPGQRAWRLLENRAAEWRDGKTGSVFDTVDLGAVEAGKLGMRIWTKDEQRLVDASHSAERQRKAVEEKRRTEKEEADRHLQEYARRLEEELTRAEKRERTSRAHHLAAESQRIGARSPQRRLILAVESIRATMDHGDPTVSAGEQALHDALKSMGGIAISGHTGPIKGLAFTTDRRLITGSNDGTARVWSLDDLDKPPVGLRGHKHLIEALALASDYRLVTGGWDHMAVVWDLGNPDAPTAVLQGHKGRIGALAVAADGRRLVTTGDDGTARLWDLENLGEPPLVLRGCEGDICAFALAPDGRFVIGESKGLVRVCNLDNPDAAPLVLQGDEKRIRTLVIDPSGRLVAASSDTIVRVWDLEDTAAEPVLLRGHQSDVIALTFGPGGRLITGSADKTACIWDLKDPDSQPIVLRGHERSINVLSVGPHDQLITGSSDGTARVWSLEEPSREPTVLRGHEDSVTTIGFAPGGPLVTGSSDGMARIWDVSSTAQPRIFCSLESQICALTVIAGDLLVIGCDWTMRIWDLREPREKPIVIPRDPGYIVAMGRMGDGRLVIGHNRSGAVVWSLNNPTDEPIAFHHRFTRSQEMLCLAVASDNLLVTGHADGSVWTWAGDRSDEPVQSFQYRDAITALAVSPDFYLATGCSDGTLWISNLRYPFEQPVLLSQKLGEISALVFTPEGNLVSSGHRRVNHTVDNSVRIWDIKNPGVQPRVVNSTGEVSALAFAPDGRLIIAADDLRIWDMSYPYTQSIILSENRVDQSLLSSTSDGRLVVGRRNGLVEVWDLDLSRLLALAPKVAGRNLTMPEWQRFFGSDPYRRTFPDFPDGVEIVESR